MKIFKVTLEQVNTLEVLVMAKKETSARYLALTGLNKGSIEFDDLVESSGNTFTSCCYEIAVPLDKEIKKEIRDYGILDEQGDLLFNDNIIEEIEEMQKQKEKEEYLKKYHLEFDLK